VILPAILEREGEDAETVVYRARPGEEPIFLAEPIRLLKTLLPDPPPATMQVRFEWSQPAFTRPVGPPAETPTSATTVSAGERIVLDRGDWARVVVNKRSTVKSPPEKVEQYLGRTGKVVWTTRDGALLEFEEGTTWFSYDELEPSR
jgi:hypothetical protein